MKKVFVFFFSVGLFGAASAATVGTCCAKGPATTAALSPLAALSIYQVGGKWTDDRGQPAELADFRGRPVVIAMFFTRCGYACPLTVAAMQQIRQALPAAARAKVAFVLVSFDSEGDGPAALRDYRLKYRLDPAGWTLLNGPADDVRALAMVLGVQFAQTAAGQFSHSSLITVLDPEGRIAFQSGPPTAGAATAVLSAIAR